MPLNDDFFEKKPEKWKRLKEYWRWNLQIEKT